MALLASEWNAIYQLVDSAAARASAEVVTSSDGKRVGLRPMGSTETPIELSLDILTSLYREGRFGSIAQYVRVSCVPLDESKVSIPVGRTANDVDGSLIYWDGRVWKKVFEVQ